MRKFKKDFFHSLQWLWLISALKKVIFSSLSFFLSLWHTARLWRKERVKVLDKESKKNPLSSPLELEWSQVLWKQVRNVCNRYFSAGEIFWLPQMGNSALSHSLWTLYMSVCMCWEILRWSSFSCSLLPFFLHSRTSLSLSQFSEIFYLNHLCNSSKKNSFWDDDEESFSRIFHNKIVHLKSLFLLLFIQFMQTKAHKHKFH